ncbi:adenylate kinase 9 [Pholidichthys leucotaenia]
MDRLLDNLNEDEVERETLLAKPTCFIVVGKPGVGKSTLARKIAEFWKCTLIDDTHLINTHIKNKTQEGIKLLDILNEGKSVPEDVMLELILARLNSPDVEHYGYVLSCLPFLSEDCIKIHEQIELIKNLKLTPDFIINVKCADGDLVQRLSGLKQHPQTGQLFTEDQWKPKDWYSKKNKEQDGKDVEEQGGEEEEEEEKKLKKLSSSTVDQMVWIPENLARYSLDRINKYKDIMLRPLEDFMTEYHPLFLLELDGNNSTEVLLSSVMSRLGSLAVKPVSIPVCLNEFDDKELPDELDTVDIFRIMSSTRTVAPGFRWRRSRWGGTCPVALKEGEVIPGNANFCIGFQDKLYILSSEEACKKFVTNPRRYLLPPMPRLPRRISIIGPPQAGKTTISKLLAEHYKAVVIDMEELLQSALSRIEQEKLDKIKEETTQAAIENITKKMEQDGGQNSVTEEHPEVQAMVLSAVEEAKQLRTSPSDLYASVLQKRIKEIKEEYSDAEGSIGWVLDNFPCNFSQMNALLQAGFRPEIVFCLKDTEGHQVLRRIYELNKESVDNAIRKRLQDEEYQKEKTVFDDRWEFGYPDGPEMNTYKLQLQQFTEEWERIQDTLTHCTVEIVSKSPEELLQEMIHQMEKPFEYVPWELSVADQEEEEEDLEALAELARKKKSSNDNDPAEKEEKEEEVTPVKRSLGDTHHFCPVALKRNNVLLPCTDEIAAKYREKTFYFSSEEAKDSFLQNPSEFVAKNEPLKPPALRIFMLGTRGSGKTTHGEWLAQQLGLFHIQFREQLQMLIMAKTKKRISRADELVSLKDNSEDLEALIRKARGDDEEEMEDSSGNMNDTEQEAVLTDDELAIQSYLSNGDTLSPQILDLVIALFWEREPYRSTGFILEGFPQDQDEVQYMLQRQLFPDVVVVMKVEVTDVLKRLLPTYLENWRHWCSKHKKQLNLLHELRKKKREEDISKRRHELLLEYNAKADKIKSGSQEAEEEEEEDESENIEDKIEAVLEEEFPVEEEGDENRENEETEDAATERLEMEIKERFVTDENNLVTVMDLLTEHNIPTMPVSASRKPKIIRYQLLQKTKPLLTNRESLFHTCQPISYSLAQKLLLSSYKLHSAFGCWDPVMQYTDRELIQPLQWPLRAAYPLLFHHYVYFFASKENRKTFMLNPLKYLRQPKPLFELPVKVAIVGPPKSGKTTVAQMFARKYGLVRLSIGGVMRTVLSTQEHTELAIQMKKYLSQGLVVPDELAIQCLQVALMSSDCIIKGYILDGFPMTLKQAEMMESRSIIPMIVVELKLDTVEVLRRGLIDKMRPNKPYLMHDSSEILHISNSCYKKEVEHVKSHFQHQYQNWLTLDGSKSKWWIWDSIKKEVSVSMKYIHIYLEMTQRRQAACINRMCITPKELHLKLGEFGMYCPVCLALHYHLLDCSETVALTHAAEYKGHFYKMCSNKHLEAFLSTPDRFVMPGCPHTLPHPRLLPRKMTAAQVKNKFPQQVEMKGFCPVTYLDGKQRYEALVQGKLEYAVEYRQRIYIFETKQKQDKFLRTPEAYWDQKLPSKVPPLCEPVSLTSLPTLGYLEQGIAVPVIKAMTAVGCLKPKYPFLSLKRSALLYVAFYLKAFNHESTDYTRQKYKKKLALFEEKCALIPYLSSAMRGNYRPPSECSIDFEFKLNRFLASRAPDDAL